MSPIVALVAAALLAPGPLAGADTSAATGGVPQGEAVVLSHLLAPCCWKQTLDVHDSDLARALRAEVRARLIAGESPSSVEQGLVVRYGEGIRAVPLADPTPKAALIGLSAVVVAGVALTLVVRRRARATPPAPHRTARDEWDVALDDELRDAD